MSELAQLYQQIILDHAKRRNGDMLLAPSDAEHHEFNPTCGDEITLRIRLDDSQERVAEIGWQGNGCSISMASASVLTELLVGKRIADAQVRVTVFREMLRSQGSGEPDEELLEDAVAFHGVSKYVMRVKCAMLAWVALEACLTQIANRDPDSTKTI